MPDATLFDSLDFSRGQRNPHSAAAHATVRKPSQRARVLAAFAETAYDGLTREQLSDMTGIKLQSVCQRVAELLVLGQIRESGRSRATASGAMAGVLVVT